jgi:chemotaxis protein histidine kinase CheA
MNAATIAAVAYRAVPTDRAHFLRELVSAVVGNAGLSHQAEQEMRRALTARLDPILELADSAVAARVELEAVERRLQRHIETHDLCRLGIDQMRWVDSGRPVVVRVQPCWVQRDIKRSLEQLQRRADREMRALLGGRR